MQCSRHPIDAHVVCYLFVILHLGPLIHVNKFQEDVMLNPKPLNP
jgi:hypothetical protein